MVQLSPQAQIQVILLYILVFLAITYRVLVGAIAIQMEFGQDGNEPVYCLDCEELKLLYVSTYSYTIFRLYYNIRLNLVVITNHSLFWHNTDS